MAMRNDVILLTVLPDGTKCTHFRLREFESKSGVAMVHPDLLVALECSRRDLNIESQHGEVAIRITCGLRTVADNNLLGRRLGFTDEEGGLVSRTSKHLPKYKGIAADWVPYYVETGRRVSRKLAALIAQRYFTFVKADYSDGHIHGDVR